MPPLRAWWTGDPHDPGRLPIDDPRVQDLLDRVAPDETVEDLGGAFSLNLHLSPSARVLRIHRPMISRTRLQAEHDLRTMLSAQGIAIPCPLPAAGSTILATGTGKRRRLAELEPFVATIEPEPGIASYGWLFDALGTLHRALALVPPVMPRAVVATWGTPRVLQRWLSVTANAVSSDPAAHEVVAASQALMPAIRRGWVEPETLPQQIVHGDFRLGNAVQSATDRSLVVFDVGFAAIRPRIWDVAYALGFMHLALGHACDRTQTDAMIVLYERACGLPLSANERRTIPAMAAIALLHTIAHAGFMANPIEVVHSQQAFVQAAARFLALGTD